MSTLDDIKARAEKATPGPWVAFEGNEADGVTSATWGQLTWDDHGGEVFKPEDAEFIAHARTDVPKLVAALEAVEAHHQPLKAKAYGGAAIQICTTCSDDVGNWEPYPCPTLTSIDEALS